MKGAVSRDVPLRPLANSDVIKPNSLSEPPSDSARLEESRACDRVEAVTESKPTEAAVAHSGSHMICEVAREADESVQTFDKVEEVAIQKPIETTIPLVTTFLNEKSVDLVSDANIALPTDNNLSSLFEKDAVKPIGKQVIGMVDILKRRKTKSTEEENAGMTNCVSEFHSSSDPIRDKKPISQVDASKRHQVNVREDKQLITNNDNWGLHMQEVSKENPQRRSKIGEGNAKKTHQGLNIFEFEDISNKSEISAEVPEKKLLLKAVLDRIKNLPNEGQKNSYRGNARANIAKQPKRICNSINSNNVTHEHPMGLKSDENNKADNDSQIHVFGKFNKKIFGKEPVSASISDLESISTAVEEVKSNGYLVRNGVFQLNEEKERKVLSERIKSQPEKNGTDSEIDSLHHIETQSSAEILSDKCIMGSPDTEKSTDENCLLVKFIRKQVGVNDISAAFSKCGPIANISIISSKMDSRFNFACITFKSRDGLQRALAKTDVIIAGSDAALEATSFPVARIFSGVLTPASTIDHGFPSALLKNPMCTVLVPDLPQYLSFHRLRDAFSCWGTISGIALSSSSSNAYIEFESRDSKEKALACSSVSVLGRKLAIHRIDAPPTTVVRISRMNPHTELSRVHSICGEHGKVKKLVSRTLGIVDVHFKLSELTNILNIINRLNGIAIDQHQWQVQPAPVIPAEILQELWSKADGRRCIYAIIQGLCKKIEAHSIDRTTALTDLAQTYYC